MENWKKLLRRARLLALCLALALLLPTLFTRTAFAASGTCGENLTWTLSDDGALVISGTGDMENYGSSLTDSACGPWGKSVKTVTIQSGVTRIGHRAFSGCASLTSVTLPSGLTSIGAQAFANCSSLTGVTIPSSVNSVGTYAFYGCSALTGVTLPKGITSWGGGIFMNCTALTKFTLPSGCTAIPSEMFSGCSALKSVTIPSGVLSISSHAFSGCASLTSVTIPAGVTKIGEGAFSGCSALTKLTIPKGATSIGQGAFSGCTLLKTAGPVGSGCNIELGWTEQIPSYAFLGADCLTTVTIPSGVTRIGFMSFQNCSALTSATFPSGVTSIADQAFLGCSALKTAALPSSVEIIGENAFNGCSALTKLTIPKGATSIGQNAFSGCSGLKTAGPTGSGCSLEFGWATEIPEGGFAGFSGLTSLTLPAGLTTIRANAFENCSSLTKLTIPSSVTVMEGEVFSGCSGLKTAGPAGSGCSIEFGWTKELPEYAFWGANYLTKVTLPSALSRISNYTFYGCNRLTSISIPSSVTSIGDIAFSYCGSLKSLQLPANLKEIGTGAFAYCRALESVTIPSGVTAIENATFRECTALKSVTIPSGVKRIGNIAFLKCESLTNLNIPAALKNLGSAAFQGCTGLADSNGFVIVNSVAFDYTGAGGNVTIPQGVTVLSQELFYGYFSMTGVTIPSGVTRIEDRVFYGCGLTSVTIPSGVKSIGEGAFYKCSSLKSVTIPKGVTSIGKAAFRETALQSVSLPEGLKSIGEDCFYGTPLKSAVIPEGVTRIEVWTFGWSAIESLTIPESVTYIGEQSTWFCDNLTDVYYAGSKFQWDKMEIHYGSRDALRDATIHYAKKYVPPAPEVSGKLNASGKPMLSWEAVEGAVKYQVYRSTTGKSGSYSLLTTTTELSVTNSSAAAGMSYYYKVRGVTEDGTKGVFSEAVKLTARPAAPTVTGSLSSGKPKLRWEAVTGAVKYQVYRSTTGKAGSFKLLMTTTNLTVTNSKAAAGTSYYYKIRAVTEDGTKGAFSEAVKLTARPAKPAVEGKLNTSGKPVLSWEAVTGAAKYEIYRSTTGKSGSFKKLTTTTKLSYTNSKATGGTTYYYKVRAVNAEGTKSLFSAVLELKAAVKPAAPKVTGKLNSKGKPVLSWKAVTGAAKYEVWRSTTGKSGSFKKLATTAKLTYTNSKAETGKTYYYKVKAVSASGLKSALSTAVQLTAKGKPAAPSVTGKLSTKGKPVLSWKAVPGAVEYKIYRSTSESGTYKLRKTTTALKYTDSKAVEGKTYYYKIKAVADDGKKSSYSVVVKLKAGEIPEKLPAPVLTTGLLGDGHYGLTWDAVPGSVKYQVWRSSTSQTEGFTRVATVTGTSYALDFSDKGTFYYKVRAVAADDAKGVYSTVLTIKIN